MLFKPVVFCCVVLYVTEYLTEAKALAEGDEGVCVVKKSSTKTKKVSYTRYNNKWCGKRKCVARATRNQRFVVTSNVMVCCSGWQYQGEACVPRCSTGCLGGRCVGPERCQCDPPTYPDPQHQNACLTPVCDPPCINARCVNDTCSCLPNFHAFNVTHCYQCDPGYDIDSSFNCIPKCDKPCLNGNCTAPGVCTCSPGYILKENSTCTPECDGCVNSECVGPNTCACLEGFSPINSTHCTPKCDDCECGVCVSPGVCKSDEGFAKTNGTCLAFCNSSCENGVCTAPDVCTCNEGYRKNETHHNVCFKPCEHPCEGNCNLHGECVCQMTSKKFRTRCTKYSRGKCLHQRKEAVESKENVCCHDYTYDEGKCVPLAPRCEITCVNAKCTSANHCTCDDGLTRLNDTHCGPPCPAGYYNDLSVPALSCISKCTQPCLNGTCTDFDTCICNAGYKLKTNSKFECEPVCKLCVNGICVAPNSCLCNAGYADAHDGMCQPVCTNCLHGDCVAPNECQCHDGYTKQGNVCVPVCDRECENGQCTRPNVCTCDANYKLDAANKFKCNPTCANKCINATCVAPDTCACVKGFVPTEDSWTCRPECDSCNNGVCVAPNKCRCNKGYAKNDSDVCLPVCSEMCVNGFCAAPEKCECNVGYEGHNDCTPVCNERCVNSTCVGPEECACWSGYSAVNTTTCTPVCSSCADGECIAPELCLCDAGYEKVNSTCVPVPLINCKWCESACNKSVCACANGTACDATEQAGVASTPTLAGLQLTWMLGGAVGLLLLVFVVVVIHRTWRQRKTFEKAVENQYNAYGSVVYTVPDTLVRQESHDDDNEADYDELDSKEVDSGLLRAPSCDQVHRM